MRPSVLGKSLCRVCVTLVAWLVWAGASGACEECILRTDYEVLLREARHVFVGRVVDAKGRMAVIRAWKGGRKEFVLAPTGGRAYCGLSLSLGRVYLTFISERGEPLPCTPVEGVWTDWSKEAITRLDRLRGFPPLSLPADDLKRPNY